MAEQLYFSRDTRMFIQFRNTTENTETAANLGKGKVWEIPVLDGYSFSQTTNTSEITLSEMESTAGVSRRGSRMFTDSLAPAEWSFSTYIRPFKSTAPAAGAAGSNNQVHAVEEVLWASMFGADNYDTSNFKFTRSTQAVTGPVLTPQSTTHSEIVITESNRSALHSFTIYFMIDTDTNNPLMYRLPESIVNEVSIDFDVEGIAMLNWTGFAKEIQDVSGSVNLGTSAPANDATTKDGSTVALGDVFIDTDTGRSFNIVSNVSTNPTGVTQAIDEATTSTKNFIRNRLTSVDIEAADGADKVAGTFPGSSAIITAITSSVFEAAVAQNGANGHGFSTGDQVYAEGFAAGTTAGGSAINGQHLFVRVGSNMAGTTDATTKFRLFGTKAQAEDTTSDTGLKTIAGTGYSGTAGRLANGKYNLVLTGGSFTIANNITYLVPEELGAINKPLEHITGSRVSTGAATCYLTLEDTDTARGTSRQLFNDMVGTGSMSKVVNKFKVTMHIGGSAATGNTTDPALKVEFPTAHITVPTHSIDEIVSLETEFTALPTDFGAADEITAITYYPVDSYA